MVTKGEIVHDEQFLLLLQCFQKQSASYASNCVYKWKLVKRCFTLILLNRKNQPLLQKPTIEFFACLIQINFHFIPFNKTQKDTRIQESSNKYPPVESNCMDFLGRFSCIFYINRLSSNVFFQLNSNLQETYHGFIKNSCNYVLLQPFCIKLTISYLVVREKVTQLEQRFRISHNISIYFFKLCCLGLVHLMCVFGND